MHRKCSRKPKIVSDANCDYEFNLIVERKQPLLLYCKSHSNSSIDFEKEEKLARMLDLAILLNMPKISEGMEELIITRDYCLARKDPTA
jgi:hypothetical protein